MLASDWGHTQEAPMRPAVSGLSPCTFPLDPDPGVFLMMPRCHQTSWSHGGLTKYEGPRTLLWIIKRFG